MIVCLMRHGEAKPKDQDPERGLTKAGRVSAAAVARTVARGAPSIRQVWHSDKRRAAETARILADCLAAGGGAALRVGEHPSLGPDDPVGPLAAELETLDQDLAVIGHLPFLDRLALKLLGLDHEDTVRIVEFETAAALCLERDFDGYRIRWFVTPGVCAG